MFKIKTTLLFAAFAFLTGCSSMNSNFDCPMKDGIRCQSLDQVNSAVDRGEIGQGTGSCDTHECPGSIAYKGSYDLTAATSDKTPLRDPESVTRVWIAPYEDTHGNYHQASNVYAVTRPGHWLGYPVKEIKDDDYV